MTSVDQYKNLITVNFACPVYGRNHIPGPRGSNLSASNHRAGNKSRLIKATNNGKLRVFRMSSKTGAASFGN